MFLNHDGVSLQPSEEEQSATPCNFSTLKVIEDVCAASNIQSHPCLPSTWLGCHQPNHHPLLYQICSLPRHRLKTSWAMVWPMVHEDVEMVAGSKANHERPAGCIGPHKDRSGPESLNSELVKKWIKLQRLNIQWKGDVVVTDQKKIYIYSPKSTNGHVQNFVVQKFIYTHF